MLPLFSILAQATQPSTQPAAAAVGGNAAGTAEAAVEISRDGSGFWLPPQASTIAPETDWVYWFIFWTSVIFTVIVLAAMVWFIIRYRYREGGPEHGTGTGHSTTLEITWTLVPLALVLMFFYYGFTGFMNQTVFPPNAYNITVTGQKWVWSFEYPNGGISPELRVPLGVPVVFTMQSQDVIHSLFVPDFRLKKDVVPGRYSKMWVQATRTGTFRVFCTEYCGQNHSKMLTTCTVMDDRAEFDRWVADLKNPRGRYTPIEWGEKLYKERGCITCHSVDGTAVQGPTWKGLWGATRNFVDGGSATADENYIMQSILYPSQHVVKGYGNVMPVIKLNTNNDIPAIIAYIKSINGLAESENYTTFEQVDEKFNKAEGAPEGQK